MKKYLTVFAVSWQDEFVYRLNFILWRVRNILRLLMTYFLWRGIFVTNQNVFGYSQNQMLTYVFLVLVIQTLIVSAPSSDNIGGEIGSGDLSNYLVKPVSYLKYWFTRDLSSKLLNLIFAVFEVGVLWLLLRPQVQLSSSSASLSGFLLCSGLAIVLYYFINVAARFIAFWTPENTWGLSFVILVLLEILAGGIFPLDVLPAWLQTGLQFTPFPYLIYYPIAVFLGKITGLYLVRVLLQSFIWTVCMYLFTKYLWHKGLKVYAAEGR
jgi:ABC-2 type transport system permease protein